ncbi:MAG: hypothetical protein IJF03_09910 [Lachnospiraceae bacterium]|nr:hypothetical protein [Lachnospiraceae bacterium]
METVIEAIAETMATITALAEVALVISMLLRIRKLEKKVTALEKEQPTVEKIASAFAKNLRREVN